MSVSAGDFVEGGRIRDIADGFRGTVRYIGQVAAAKNKTEVWLGIEWDNAERGKHDGSCVDEEGKLHRYFECANGAGSFIKPGKVTAGRTFIDALKERYVHFDAPEIALPDSTLPDAFVVTSKGNQKPIELLGERQIRKWQQIDAVEKVAIRNDSISTIGDDVPEIAAHIVEVDLQDNLIWQWTEVAKLASQMPKLESLLLHGNKMQNITVGIITQIPRESLRNIRVLALNKCNITSWASIQLLEPLLPNLEELCLAANSLGDLPGTRNHNSNNNNSNNADGEHVESVLEFASTAVENYVHGFPSLRLLDIAFCELEDWAQVLNFANLPSLRELVLDGNRLPSILLCPVDGFKQLERLSISANKFESWSDINSLATYPVFHILRLSQIPLFANKGASEVRPIVIGRIKNLNFFNGSGVSPRERVDAEKSYLRTILRRLDEQQQQATATAATADAVGDESGASATLLPDHHLHPLHNLILATDPRYEELQATYGADLPPMGKISTGANLASDLVSITFKNLSFGSGGSLEPVTKKLPVSLTVSRVKLMVKQLFGLDIHLQLLSVRTYKDSPPVLLDDDQSTLGYFGAIDGSEIFINEADSK